MSCMTWNGLIHVWEFPNGVKENRPWETTGRPGIHYAVKTIFDHAQLIEDIETVLERGISGNRAPAGFVVGDLPMRRSMPVACLDFVYDELNDLYDLGINPIVIKQGKPFVWGQRFHAADGQIYNIADSNGLTLEFRKFITPNIKIKPDRSIHAVATPIPNGVREEINDCVIVADGIFVGIPTAPVPAQTGITAEPSCTEPWEGGVLEPWEWGVLEAAERAMDDHIGKRQPGDPVLAERFKLKRYLHLTEVETIENERMWAEEHKQPATPLFPAISPPSPSRPVHAASLALHRALHTKPRQIGLLTPDNRDV